MLSVCIVIVELQCYSQLYKMLKVSQQCVYGTFFRWQQCRFYVRTEIIFQLICTIFTLRTEAVLKENSARLWIDENNIPLFVAFILDVQFACTDCNDVSLCVVSQIL